MADVVARGVRFNVQRIGRGDRTVVFLHGLVMDNLSSWYFTVANAAARSADVILYDLRGHGRSDRPSTGYTVDDMVADLDALLAELGVAAPLQLVGNSFGGLLGLKFAAVYPQRTRSLALVDAHLSDDEWGGEMSRTLALSGPERDRKIGESFASWLGRHSARKRSRLAQTAEALVYQTSLSDDLRRSAPLSDIELRSVRCPVMALYGERSDLRANAARLARTIPVCRLRILEGCTHAILWEATDAVKREIVDWLCGPES
jgi:pimeloyl-ACP methyl ester carboxylesterase